MHMNSLLKLLASIKKNSYKTFYLKNLGKKYDAEEEQLLSIEKVKELFFAALKAYFSSSISRLELKLIANDLMFSVVKKHWDPPKNKKFFDLKFGKDEELYHDLYWIAESSDYFLASKSWEMNPAIINFVSDLKGHYRKYNTSIKNSLIVEARFELPFKIHENIITLSESEVKNLFVILCKEHDLHKISVDTLSAVAELILDKSQVTEKNFSNILRSASELAELERKCDDEKIYLEFRNEINAINNYLNNVTV